MLREGLRMNSAELYALIEVGEIDVVIPEVQNCYTCGNCHQEFRSLVELRCDPKNPNFCSDLCKRRYIFSFLKRQEFSTEEVKLMVDNPSKYTKEGEFSVSLALFGLATKLKNKDIPTIKEKWTKRQAKETKGQSLTNGQVDNKRVCILYTRCPLSCPLTDPCPKPALVPSFGFDNKKQEQKKWF